MRRGAAPAVAAAVLVAACAIRPPPPSPEPPIVGIVQDGRLAQEPPQEAAFCVSQQEPLSVAVEIPDGAAVRPAPGAVTATRPDFALTLRRPPLVESRLPLPQGADYRMRVAGDGPDSLALTARLTSALATCVAPSPPLAFAPPPLPGSPPR